MKKLLLVGVVGLSALLGGCGGGGDCEEDQVLPPVSEAQFPNEQAPEYIVREESEIGFSRVNGSGYSAQVLALETNPDTAMVSKVVVQEFTADYSEGYLTKPTNSVREYGYSQFNAVLGEQKVLMTNYDIHKVKGALLTVQQRGGTNDISGNFIPTFDIYFPVVGVLEDVTDTTFRVNGIVYPKGIATDSEGSVDIYIGRPVAGMFDGEKLNIYATSFASPAFGFAHEVVVSNVVDEMSFSYINADGAEIVVNLKGPLATVTPSDRLLNTDKLSAGVKVLVTGHKVDNNNLEVLEANVYLTK